MWAAIINILIGLWLMICPYLFQFDKTASNNSYIAGTLIITFAIIALWEVNRSARFLTMMAGGWMILSPFILNLESMTEIWLTILSGILTAAFSFVRGEIKGNYGGGWRSLFKKDPAHLQQE
jgi:hypothetical protein